MISKVLLAVDASMAGNAAEKVYAREAIRWWSTISALPAQKPPLAHSGPLKEPTIMSTCDVSTFCASVIPRPVLPRTPKDQVSSRIRRNLYCNLSSIYSNLALFLKYLGLTYELWQINGIPNIL